MDGNVSYNLVSLYNNYHKPTFQSGLPLVLSIVVTNGR